MIYIRRFAILVQMGQK